MGANEPIFSSSFSTKANLRATFQECLVDVIHKLQPVYDIVAHHEVYPQVINASFLNLEGVLLLADVLSSEI